MVQLSKAPSTDNADGPATSVNAAILECATFFKQVLPDSLFEVSGALVNMMDAGSEQILDRSGSRIWTKVSVTDYAGTVSADLSEKAALILTDTADQSEFLDQEANGFLAFARARLRLRFAVGLKKSRTKPHDSGGRAAFF